MNATVKQYLQLTKPTIMLLVLFTGATGLAILASYVNWLTALLSLATILFYGLFYTLLLEPTTSQNIVIGGAAGAMAPVGAWAAVTGGDGLGPVAHVCHHIPLDRTPLLVVGGGVQR